MRPERGCCRHHRRRCFPRCPRHPPDRHSRDSRGARCGRLEEDRPRHAARTSCAAKMFHYALAAATVPLIASVVPPLVNATCLSPLHPRRRRSPTFRGTVPHRSSAASKPVRRHPGAGDGCRTNPGAVRAATAPAQVHGGPWAWPIAHPGAPGPLDHPGPPALVPGAGACRGRVWCATGGRRPPSRRNLQHTSLSSLSLLLPPRLGVESA